MSDPSSAEEAKAIMSGGLGEAELKLALSFCAPLFWQVLDQRRRVPWSNGTAFFLDAGEGLFGVTASHVITSWLRERECGIAGPLRLGANGRPLEIDMPRRIIDWDDDIDIATFRVDQKEVDLLGKTALTGYQTVWPPSPPTRDKGIFYCGYPGAGTRTSVSLVEFGGVAGSGVASSISETDVSTDLDRPNLKPALGSGMLPENYNFGGMSGGPMLTVIDTGLLRCWQLAGVIYSGPNTELDTDQAIGGVEIVKARRADFIRPDGMLDKTRWGWLR